jgi:hypothetical protein
MVAFFRTSASCLVALVLVCCAAPPATAQLKSFAAIRVLAVEPPLPGTQKAHKELMKFLTGHTNLEVVRLRTNGPYVSPSKPERFARCTLRTDLPKPSSFGLECHDHAGLYVGTLRTRTMEELKDRCLKIPCDRCGPRAMPLTQYEYIWFEPSHIGVAWYDDYVADLLRADGSWQVLQPRAGVPPLFRPLPPDDSNRGLRASISLRPKPDLFDVDPGFLQLMLFDASGQAVRDFVDRHPGTGDVRPKLQKIARWLIDARREDEEIYKPLPKGPG